MNALTKWDVTIRVSIIMALTEFFIMVVFRYMPYHFKDIYFEAALDAILLVILATPSLYFWVIRPFVAERDGAISRVNHLALTDPLTGLANRRLILRDLDKAIAGHQRHDDYGALLLMDLDGFKSINDCYGHKAGDAVLIAVAERLRYAARAEDVVGRLGGDEFVLILHRLGVDYHPAKDGAASVASKLIEEICQPIIFKNRALRVGVSIGICILGADTADADTAITDADHAMYQAKDAGKARWVCAERRVS